MMGQGSMEWASDRMTGGERLSAAMDSEWQFDTEKSFSAKQLALPERLDAEGQQDWSLYHLIGDALRSDDLTMAPAAERRFAASLSARLENELAFVAPSAPVARIANRRDGLAAGWFARHGRMVPSFAAAAAVATLAWVLVPSMHGATSGHLDSSTNTQIAALNAPGSGQGNWQRVNLNSDRALDPYLQAHQQFATDGGGLGYASYAGSGSVEN